MGISKPDSRLVLGFDSWTGGSRHFIRLVDSLEKEGYRLMLLHLGSWGVDIKRPNEEKIEGLSIRDIKYYNGASFKDIIEMEKPVLVLFLSTETFAHRAFNRIATFKGIPTVRLYHGIMQVLSTSSTSPYNRNIFSYVRFVLQRIAKMLIRVWPAYLKSLYQTRSSLKEYWFFVLDNIAALKGTTRKIRPSDSVTNMFFVYTNADIDHAVERYKIPRDRVVAVGNPDLIQFGLHDEQIGTLLTPEQQKAPLIMYVDTALVLRGSIFSNSSEFIAHLIETKHQIESCNKRMIVKLHPDHYRTDIPAHLTRIGIPLCPSDGYVSQLADCCAAIVEPSSAAVIPALLGVPLLLAKYNKLSLQEYGPVLEEYPYSSNLSRLKDLEGSLNQARKLNQNKGSFRSWILTNSGPLPSKGMPERVASNISHLIVKV